MEIRLLKQHAEIAVTREKRLRNRIIKQLSDNEWNEQPSPLTGRFKASSNTLEDYKKKKKTD